MVYSAAPSGHGVRSYWLDILGGAPHVLTPEGTAGTTVTPDGKFALVVDAQQQAWLYPLGGGEPQKLHLILRPNEDVVSFLDTQSLLLRAHTIPADVTRVDIRSGRRELWKQIVPPDAAGVQSIPVIRFSADGKSYAYSIFRILSDLYVVDQLK